MSLVPDSLHVLGRGPIARCPFMVNLLQVLCWVCPGNFRQDWQCGAGTQGKPPGQAAALLQGPPTSCGADRGGETREARRGQQAPAKPDLPSLLSRLSPCQQLLPFPLQIAPVTLEFRTKTQKGDCLASPVSPEASKRSRSSCGQGRNAGRASHSSSCSRQCFYSDNTSREYLNLLFCHCFLNVIKNSFFTG